MGFRRFVVGIKTVFLLFGLVCECASAYPGTNGLQCTPKDVHFDERFSIPSWLETSNVVGANGYIIDAPNKQLLLAVASTQEQRSRGLMCVRHVPSGEGMLFVFPAEKDYLFWMKDTLISLDIIFMNSDGLVNYIAQDVPPMVVNQSDEKIARRSGHARFVIELPAGGAASAGIRVGDYVKIPFFGI